MKSKMPQGRVCSLLETAKEYKKRGWAIVPAPLGSKAPILPGWQNLRLTLEDLPQHFENNQNIGVLLGKPSGWLVDIDLDCPEALQVADFFLPQTYAVFGRESKPRSHWLYYCPGAKTTRFEYGGTIAEIRSTGAQTIFPGSLHPSGEEICWDLKGEPAQVDFVTLKHAVAKLAACVLLGRHYPPRGTRQFAAMALAGWLLRNGWSDDEVRNFLEALCKAAGDEETRMRIAQIRNTGAKVEADLPATGFPTLKEYYPEAVLNKVSTWLHLNNIYNPEPSIELTKRCSDLGNAERLVEYYGNLIRFVPEWGWLVWDGKRWSKEAGKYLVLKYAEETVRKIYLEANQAPTQEERAKLAKWAMASENQRRISSMINLATPKVLAKLEDFDKDPFLLNCENGVVDLRTGELLPHEPELMLTKLCPVSYNPNSKAPRWLQFLDEIFCGGKELIEFVQRALGYSVTSDVREDKFFICWGRGRNGKSTLLGTVQRVLGDYAKQVAPDALLKRTEKGDSHPTAIADLCGSRLALVQETEEGRHLASAMVKTMTGRDKIKARYMRRDYFEFEPTHKIWLSTNYKPIINDTTVAMWSRILLIPFIAFFGDDKCDKTLPENLWNEREGILAWLVEGCIKWQQEGLKPPKVVVEATKEYQSDMDILQRWLEECCVYDPQAVVPFKELYASYESWCKKNDETPISKRKFSSKLEEKGFEVVVLAGNQRGRKGLKLKPVNQVNHFPIYNLKSSTYKSLYRNQVNIVNLVNSPEEISFESSQPRDLNTEEEPQEPDLDNTPEEVPTPKFIDPSCPVCSHPQRRKIEYLFDQEMSPRYLSKKYGVPKEAIFEHCRNHRARSP